MITSNLISENYSFIIIRTIHLHGKQFKPYIRTKHTLQLHSLEATALNNLLCGLPKKFLFKPMRTHISFYTSLHHTNCSSICCFHLLNILNSFPFQCIQTQLILSNGSIVFHRRAAPYFMYPVLILSFMYFSL